MADTSTERAKILVATELSVPPAGFVAPHRLAVVTLGDGRRRIAIVDGPLPVAGSTGTLRTDPEGRTWWTTE